MAGSPSVMVRILGDSKGFTAEMSKTESVAGKVGGAIKDTLAGAFRLMSTAAVAGAGALTAFGIDSFKTAARVGEMNATLRALSKGNDDVYATMTKTVSAIREQGIEYGVAQNLVAQFSRNQLDLAKSTDLARVAQDAAVISGQNSSETLDQLIHGITTQNSLVLRNAGVNVQAGKAMDEYAASIGKSTRDLSEAERAQGVLNAVIEAGGPIAGAYAGAMEEPGKVLRSFPRIVDDIKVSVGEGLVTVFGPAILRGYELAKAFADSIKEGGNLRPIIDGLIDRVKPLADWFGDLARKAAEFIKNIPPGMVDKITGALEGMGGKAAGAGTAIGIMGIKNIPVLGNLLGGINPLVGGFAAMVLSTESGRDALKNLWAAVKPLLPDLLRLVNAVVDLALNAVTPLLPPLVELVSTVLPPLVSLVAGAAEGIAAFSNVLGPLADYVVAVAAAIGVFVLAVKAIALAKQAWAAAQMLVNVALNANPIGLIILGIVALVAVIIVLVKNFETIRNVAKAVWDWIAGNWPLLIGIIGGPIGIAIVLVVKYWDQVTDAVKAVIAWVRQNWPLLVAIITGPIGIAVLAVVKNFDAIKNGISTVIGWFRELPGKIVSALGDVGRMLYDAGRKIITGLIDGVKSMVGAVGDAIGGVASKIKGFLPFSPAKEGPLSGMGDPRHSGRAIVGSLIQGMQDQRGALARTMDSLTGDIALGGPANSWQVMNGGGSTSAPTAPGGPAVVIQNATFNDEADIEAFMRSAAWAVTTGSM